MSEFDGWGASQPEFMVLEHSDSSREWAGPKEMDTGLFQWLLLWRTPLDNSKESKCGQSISMVLLPLLSCPLLQQGLGR